jgi:ATP-dependent Clp protease ATP-binding subunit ClpA
MFERFTDDARKSVVLAQDEARALQHDHIGTEHLLLGLLHTGEGLAADVLHALGVSLEDVRAQVLEIVGRGEADAETDMLFTPRAKKVLELSLRESMQFGHHGITGGHILLALVREGEGVAAQGLHQIGVDLAAIRTKVLEELGGEPAPERRGLLRRGARRAPAGGGAPSGGEAPARARGWTLERVDDNAWDAVSAARSSARQRDATAIGMIDLLSGVAAVAGPGAEVLRATDIDVDALHGAIHATSGNRVDALPALAFTGATRDALELAIDVADRYGHPAATTAHILLAIVMQNDAELTAVLDDLGISTDDVRIAAARRIDAL